jgi:hypothetical protein
VGSVLRQKQTSLWSLLKGRKVVTLKQMKRRERDTQYRSKTEGEELKLKYVGMPSRDLSEKLVIII